MSYPSLNDRDALLEATSPRVVNQGQIRVSVVPDAPSFHLNAAGVPDYTTINLRADLVGVIGSVSWGAVGATLSGISGANAQLAWANVTGSFVTVTASVTSGGQTYSGQFVITIIKDGAAGASTYTWTKYSNSSNGASMQDSSTGMSYIGQAFNKSTPTASTNPADYTWTLFKGADGASPNKSGTAYLFQWSMTAPANPNANSTFTWASVANTAYAGTDNWYIASALPANPGTPGMRLYVAAVPVSAAYSATTTSVSYVSATVTAYGANGAVGPGGAQSGEAVVYQWAATIPAGPVGSPSFKWSDGTFGAAPANWALTPGTSPTPGYTLWKARVLVIDTAGVATTAFNWTSASITAAGMAGTSGTPAMWVEIATSGGQVFSRATSAAAYAPTSITLSATPYGGAASAHQWQYWTGSTWTDIASATSSTLAVASGDFTTSRVYRVKATIGGTIYYDEMTLVQVTGGGAGADALVAFLTNESQTLPATAGGAVTSYTGAATVMKVYKGATDDSANWQFSYSASTVDVTYSATTNTVVITGIGNNTEVGYLDITASQTGNPSTLKKRFTISKSKAGASTPGAEGASYVTAYCASTTASTTTAPASTAGKNSVPAVNGGGITGTWSKAVPTLTSGQFMYQSDGIYNPANDTVTWSIPYWSSLKVGSLSAISANLGAITGGSIDIGTGATSWHVDSLGNMWAGAATYGAAPFRVSNTGAITATSGTFSGALSGKIVTASNLAADAVTASSVKVTGAGGALNRDPYFTDPASWYLTNLGSAANAGGAAPAATYVAGTVDYASSVSERFPIDASKSYSTSVSVYATSGNNRNFRVTVYFWDKDGNVIFTPWSDAYGANTTQLFAPGGDDTWRTYKTGGFGAKVAGRPIPSGAQSCSISAQINAGGTGTASYMSFTGLRVDLMAENTTIAPGSVETKHLKLSEGGDISSGQAAFNSGIGFWIEGAGNGHGARMSLGNSGGARMVVDPNNNVFEMIGPKVTNAAITSNFSVWIDDINSLNNVTNQAAVVGSSAHISNGSGSYDYLWSFTAQGPSLSLTSGPAATSATVKSDAGTGWRYGSIALTLKDRNTGAIASAQGSVRIQMGSGAEP